jgi:large-conductance mechanosensitive channel
MDRGLDQIYGARDQIYGARDQLKQFLKNNDVVTTISGVTVAVAAGNMIRSFVNEIVFPIFYYLIKTKYNGDFSPINAKNIAKFSKESMAFIFTLIATYLFVKYLLRFMFQFDGTIKDKKEKNNNSQESEGTPVSRLFKQQRGPK